MIEEKYVDKFYIKSANCENKVTLSYKDEVIESQPVIRTSNYSVKNVEINIPRDVVDIAINTDYHDPFSINKNTLDNPLLDNIDNLWENIGNVFHEKCTIQKQYIFLTDYIKNKFPTRKIEWNNDVLTVDGAETTIAKIFVKVSYESLTKITSPKMAEKLIGRAIVSKLKKLF